jgi:hypothetical protein
MEVGLTMKERRAVVEATAERYQRSGKKEKGRILDEFTLVAGYNRSYASHVLRSWGSRVYAKGRVYVAGSVRKKRRVVCREYDERVAALLRRVWVVMDYICGKRLQPIMGEIVDRLEQFGEIRCDLETREKLKRISASTIDRLLAPERRKHQLKGRSRTRPGTLLKHQIPLRTFSEWDEKVPGFVEIDLVAHDGGVAAGEHLYTLCVTDIATGWTEVAAVKNKARVWVFEALKSIRRSLPFKLLGIDSDNGGEFINRPLYEYCIEEHLTFTRSRPYRKNDNCFVEQKNWTVVRRHVGYQRLEGTHQQAILGEIYDCLRHYVNFFQPSMKLKSKQRTGSRVKKTYSAARTPYQNLIESKSLSNREKRMLEKQYQELNPAQLMRRIQASGTKLQKMAAIARNKKVAPKINTPWRGHSSLFE